LCSELNLKANPQAMGKGTGKLTSGDHHHHNSSFRAPLPEMIPKMYDLKTASLLPRGLSVARCFAVSDLLQVALQNGKSVKSVKFKKLFNTFLPPPFTHFQYKKINK
jgi:hypothetical protein